MRLISYTAACCIAACIFLCSDVRLAGAGDAPAASEQNEGFTVRNVGAMEFFSFQDRAVNMPASIFTTRNDPALVKKYMPRNSAPASVSVFAVKRGDSVILMDAGYGSNAPGPGTSALMLTMAKAGITPDMVDLVLLTHMHMDHTAGLLTAEGTRAFPRAKVLVSVMEASYWLFSPPKPGQEANFELAAKVKAAYGEDFLTPFAFGDTVAPGITALDASGHTPGHTVYQLESEGKRLLVIGDLLHAALLQFPEPAVSSSYDMDPIKAADTRLFYLNMAAEKDVPVAGMHLPFPPVGKVGKREGGGFVFTPAER